MFLTCGRYTLSLARPLIMGVINVTPDSFSDGGKFSSSRHAIDYAYALLAEGADILDIGGESTRPGAAPVSLDEERQRVLPVIEALAHCKVPVSVDTQKPQIMREAIAAGASMVNDVNGFREPETLEAVAGSDAGICIMHMQGASGTMQNDPQYHDVVTEVRDYLADRVQVAEAAGIARSRIAVDPGFGFGKTFAHNIALLRELGRFKDLAGALLVGLSRKSLLGKITGRAPADRVHASIAAALCAVQHGAQIVRVHDVAATRDALAVWGAISQQ